MNLIVAIGIAILDETKMAINKLNIKNARIIRIQKCASFLTPRLLNRSILVV